MWVMPWRPRRIYQTYMLIARMQYYVCGTPPFKSERNHPLKKWPKSPPKKVTKISKKHCKLQCFQALGGVFGGGYHIYMYVRVCFFGCFATLPTKMHKACSATTYEALLRFHCRGWSGAPRGAAVATAAIAANAVAPGAAVRWGVCGRSSAKVFGAFIYCTYRFSHPFGEDSPD